MLHPERNKPFRSIKLLLVDFVHQDRLKISSDNSIVEGFVNADTLELIMNHEDSDAIVNGAANFIKLTIDNGSAYHGKNMKSSFCQIALISSRKQ